MRSKCSLFAERLQARAKRCKHRENFNFENGLINASV